MLTAKHKGFGRWYVVDGDTVVAGPMTKPEAEARAVAVQVVPAGDELARRRAYERRMENDLRNERNERNTPFKALLDERFDEDTATRLWMQIEPMLNAGREGVGRQIGRNMRSRAA